MLSKYNLKTVKYSCNFVINGFGVFNILKKHCFWVAQELASHIGINFTTEIWIHEKKSLRTGPGTARKFGSVLEPDPELPKYWSQP